MNHSTAALLSALLVKAKATTPPVTLAQIADGHKPQLELMERASEQDASRAFIHRNILALCSRRAAKSTSIMALLATDASENDGVQIYFGKTKPAVRLSIWQKVWKPFIKKHFHIKGQFEVVHNETSMVSTFPNGAIVAFTGTDDVAHVESYLGNKLRRAVLDECFPAGTIVDGRPIETIRIGETVACVDHLTGAVVRRRVVRLKRSLTLDLVTVVAGSTGFTSTAKHPVFVKGKGYVYAEDLRDGDLLCVRSVDAGNRRRHEGEDVRPGVHGDPVSPDGAGTTDRRHLRAVWKDVQDVADADSGEEALQYRMFAPSSPDVVGGEEVPYAGGQGEDRRRDDGEQSDAQSGGSREDDSDPSRDQSQATGPWRQRSRSDGGRDGVVASDRVANRCGREDEPPPAGRVRISDLLQAGCGGRSVDDVYRGRWSEPRPSGTEGAGREEDGVLDWSRVESVSRVEPGSPEGTTVYNLEVEGAHTYFANGVLVHNCQAQNPSVLDPLVDRILPPALSDVGGQLILSGTIPEVPAGKFYDLWQMGNGWLKRNWSRFQNPHLGTVEHQMARLAEYLATSGRKITDSLVRRDWFGELVFETNVTAYSYSVQRNGYHHTEPEWLADWLQNYEGDPFFAHIHRTLAPNDGTARNGIMAAKPFDGIEVFSCAIDPGASDRFSIEVVGWGSGCDKVQQVFEFSSERGAGLHWSHVEPIRRLIQAMYAPSWWYYDASGSKVVLDSFVGDTGLPALMPAAKAGFRGQVQRVSDLLIKGWFQVMIGSALEEDYQKARWDPDARAKLQWRMATQWHPDPAESTRYALGAFLDLFEEPEEPRSPEEIDREATELANRRRNAAKMGGTLDEDMDRAIQEDDEESTWD